MAYLNEFGETVNAPQMGFFEKLIYLFTDLPLLGILPLAVLVIIYFVLKRFVKNKKIVLIYAILVAILYVIWIVFLFALFRSA